MNFTQRQIDEILEKISKSGYDSLTKEEKEAGIKHLAKKQGCFHIIGAKQIDNVKEIIICEGFATAVSIHEAIKKPVVMGIDIYNIENLVKIFKDKFPDKNIIY